MSNQASTKRSAAAAVAAPSSQDERRQAASATARSKSARPASKPAHATSQCDAACVDGRSWTRNAVHGTRTAAATANTGMTQPAGRQTTDRALASTLRTTITCDVNDQDG